MKKLIIAEKPSVARELATVLGQFNSRDGYLENDDYVVTWAIGHLVRLAEPEDYDNQLKKWSLDTLPIIPGKFKLKTNPKTAKQFKIVKQLVNRSDIGELVCATDAGREGELIFRYIYRLTGSNKPFMRLWLSETTPAAVQRGFAELRPGDQYNALAAAAEARSQADWLIGINATRAFTVKHNTLLSIGRVQTPTLALIVNREREIKNFVPEPYWELYAEFAKSDGQVYTGKWFKGKQNRFPSPEQAREIQYRVDGRPASVREVEEKDVSELPPLLFNLNDLQKEANKKYGLAAAKTLELAQTLYETRKLLTYPRTDSRHITLELAKTIPGRLSALAGVPEYELFISTARAASTPGKRYVDDGKVSDHTALIPTDIKPNLDNLPPDERKIYDLVARRFLAVFFPPARYKQTKVITEAAGETFLTTGRVELDKGWKTVYTGVENDSDEGEGSGVIPELAKGESVRTAKTEIRQKETKPPKRYTEASLLAVMEGAGKLMEDQELKAVMKEHGLGTPATRAAIIERLIEVGYVERQKKTLVPTDKGETLIDLFREVRLALKINPIVYNNSALYGSWYLEGNGSDQAWLMIEFLQKHIPTYSHEDVYRFLTDSDFRKYIVGLAKENVSAYLNPYKLWMRKYERQIGKKNWYKEMVRIVSNLKNLPDPNPLFPSPKEVQIYNTIVNSYQYIIPVVFSRIPDGEDGKHDIFYKQELLFYFETYGFEFLEFYTIGGGLGNTVLFIQIKLKQYHTYEKEIMEIYLPFNELVTLYQKLFKKEFPHQHGCFNYYNLGKIANNSNLLEL